MKIFFWLLIFLFFSFMVVNYGFTLQHESAHKEIYADYGIESTIHLNNPIKAMTTGVGGYTKTVMTAKEYDSKCNETCLSLHAQNEIIGYNMEIVMASIFVLIMFLIILSAIFYEKMFQE